MSFPSLSKLRSANQVCPSSQEIVVRPMSPCATMTGTRDGAGVGGGRGSGDVGSGSGSGSGVSVVDPAGPDVLVGCSSDSQDALASAKSAMAHERDMLIAFPSPVAPLPERRHQRLV